MDFSGIMKTCGLFNSENISEFSVEFKQSKNCTLVFIRKIRKKTALFSKLNETMGMNKK